MKKQLRLRRGVKRNNLLKVTRRSPVFQLYPLTRWPLCSWSCVTYWNSDGLSKAYEEVQFFTEDGTSVSLSNFQSLQLSLTQEQLLMNSLTGPEHQDTESE